MSCETVRENLLAHLYGALTREDERLVTEHLETCADCRVALAHAEMECAALSEASRLDASDMEFRAPDSGTSAKPRGRIRHIGRISAAAAVLVAALGLLTYWLVQRAPVYERHPRLVVTGPTAIPPKAPARFVIRTETVKGDPIDAKIEAVVTGRSGVLHRAAGTSGQPFEFDLPAGIGKAGEILRLDVRASYEGNAARAATLFARDASRLSAYVATDKPLYRPGEIIRARAVVLERFGLTPAGSSPVKLGLVGPNGDKLREVGVQSESGVAAFHFRVPENATGGEYKVVASHPDGAFPETARAVSLRAYHPPRLKADVELDRDSYGPGDSGMAWLSVTRAEGGIPTDATVVATIHVDGAETARTEHSLMPDGSLAVPFLIPDAVAAGRSRINLVISDGGVVQPATKTIPVTLDRLEATLLPEGGELVAGLSNRVYFSVRDLKGAAADLTADVVNGAGRTVATAKVETLGMGSFDFVPRQGESYSLVPRKPAGVRIEGEPLAPVTSGVVLRAAVESAPANSSLDFDLTSTASGEHSVAAWCRGVLVAQQAVALEAGKTRRLALAPTADVGGVFRVTVLDPAGRPAAERLVSRAPARRLDVSVRPETDDFSPGETVKVVVTTVDEDGKPVPAVLGVAVVDDAVLALADDEDTAPLPMHFLLGLEVEELERTELFADGPGSARAVDLLLGTQGWRRFAWRDRDAFVAAHPQAGPRVLPGKAAAAGMFTVDNLEEARRAVHRDLTDADGRSAAAGVFLLIVAFVIGCVYGLYRFWRWILKSSGAGPVAAAVCGSVSTVFVLFLLMVFMMQGGMASRMAPGSAGALWGTTDAAPVESEVLILADLDDITDGLDDVSGTIEVTFSETLNEEIVLDARLSGVFVLEGGEFSRVRGTPSIVGNVGGAGGAGSYEIEYLRSVDLPQGARIFWLSYVQDERRLGRLVMLPGYYPMEAYERVYAHKRKPEGSAGRTDFAEVLYWNPLVVTDENGRAELEFDTPDSITSFRVSAEAHDERGGLGTGSSMIRNRVPFWIEPKLPVALTEGDKLLLPVVAANDTRAPASVMVDLLGVATETVNVPAGGRERVIFELVAGKEDMKVSLAGGQPEGMGGDRTERTIPVSPRGYPIEVGLSGRLEKRAKFPLLLPAETDRATIRGDLRLYPSVISELADGIDSMLRQPCGCFEQVSSSTYPNVLILSYLTEMESAAPAVARRAKDYLEDGYAKLAGYECDGGGFDWYGGDSGHEALTAYGLMEFTEMTRFVQVDTAMIDRTRDWLLSRRDGEGGFRTDTQRRGFGRAPAEVANAYILWSLTEAGVTEGLDAETALLEKTARASEDPYLIALSALTLQNLESPAAKELVRELARLQRPDGGLAGTGTSITASRGENLVTETTALATIAFLTDGGHTARAERAALFLGERRRGGGTFGATQATVLTLKALVTHARLARRTATDHDLTVYVNGRAAADRHVPAGSAGAVVFGDAVVQALVPGRNEIDLRTTGGETLPFFLSLRYRSDVPPSDPKCAVDVTPVLAKSSIREGESLDLTVTLRNREAAEVPMTVARVGLPAGLTPRVERLRDLKDAGEIAFFETRPREVTLYLYGLSPKEERKLVLDLVADVPGTFEGPATSAYLYYDDDRQYWAPPLKVRIDPR